MYIHSSMYPAMSLFNIFLLITYYRLENVMLGICIMVSKSRTVIILMEKLQPSENDLHFLPWYNDSADCIKLLTVYFVFWWQKEFCFVISLSLFLTTLYHLYPRPFPYISKLETPYLFPSLSVYICSFILFSNKLHISIINILLCNHLLLC